MNNNIYLFFDTETTGLPTRGADYKLDFDHFPRIVQIAWRLTDNNGKLMHKYDAIIRPEGYVIPDDSIVVHKITNEEAMTSGQDILSVLRHFIIDAGIAKKLIAHNINFDTSIIKSELYRLNVNEDNFCEALDKEKRIDTMRSTIKFVDARYPDGKSGKWPRLEELYLKLFGEEITGAHSAVHDVENLEKCYFELVKLNIL